MAFPTTPIIDTFVRADEDPLATSSSGATWNPTPLFGNTMRVVSNQMANSSGGEGSQVLTNNYGPDCEIYVTLAVTTDMELDLFIRESGTGSSASGYLFDCQPGATPATSGFTNIERFDAPFTITQLGSSSSGNDFSNGVQFGGSVIGNQLISYRNGVALVTTSDSTYTAAGRMGPAVSAAAAFRGTQFGGGTIAAASTGLAWIKA